MKHLKSFWICAVSFLLVACASQIRASAPVARFQGTTVPTDKELEQVTAVAKYTARAYGMDAEPTKIAVKKTTLSEWFTLIGAEFGDDAAKFGLDPNRPIYIVVMLGDGTWRGPGGDPAGDAPSAKFDNLRLAVAADTFDVIGSGAAGPDEELPLGVKRDK